MTLASWYGQALDNLFNGNIDLANDTIKVALLDNTYTPNVDTHEFWAGGSGISGDEVSGTGYTTGGETLANQAVAYITADDAIEFDGDDVVWSASTITAAYAVLYVTGTAGVSDFLLGYVDFEGDEVSSSGDFTITWNANGILRLTAV